MKQVSPGQKVPIVRQIDRAAIDSNTYYIKAVIRNSVTGATLDTVELTDQGDQRFTGTFETPIVDDELFLDIETKVYTDSGYTTLSQSDAVESEQFVVREAWNRVLAGVGGMASESKGRVDYKQIREIIADEIKKAITNLDWKKILSPVVELVGETMKAIKELDIPEATDISDLTSSVQSLHEDLLKIPTEPTDLAPVLERAQNILDEVATIKDSVQSSNTELSTSHQNFVENVEKAVGEIVNKVKESIAESVKENVDKQTFSIQSMNLQMPGAQKTKESSTSSLLRTR